MARLTHFLCRIALMFLFQPARVTVQSLKTTSSTEINVTPKRLKIAKFRLQILVVNLKSYLKLTYVLNIEEKMTEL